MGFSVRKAGSSGLGDEASIFCNLFVNGPKKQDGHQDPQNADPSHTQISALDS